MQLSLLLMVLHLNNDKRSTKMILYLLIKITKRMDRLLNSGIDLTANQIAEVEEFIFNSQRVISKSRLNHYKCLAAIRSDVVRHYVAARSRQ